ncbi:CD248 molecule, endosialin a [Anabas testudineus]|uniref:CD248 molecule, endosialin a n=1 Tax=Anabas testudineus TaxID=64144 RepID=UPI000E465035|nr:CD248 molecule, endosialin a [Anabas testudineus]
MGSLIFSAAALLLTFLLALLFEVSSVLCQDLTERDAICKADGCYVVYFQRKTFLDSWRACKAKGGNLATIKRKEEAATIATLFSTLDLRNSRTKVRVWIGLQRQPRQCSTTRLLRGYSWTTGDQDTEYSNWQREDSPSMCSVPRCVVMDYSTQEPNDNLKWLDGPCSVPVDGYLCYYTYKGMCPALWSEGAGNALYSTPFNLLSTLLTHVPFGTVATVPCPAGTQEEQSVLCTLKEDGSVGWSKESPICWDSTVSHNRCDKDNGGCEHFCKLDGAHFYCECASGYQLADNGQSCELSNVCQGAPCEFECLPLSDGYSCACPEGYMLAPDERSCLDVNECLQSPCEQICVNALGTFECRCLEGYYPDDEGVCKDIDECINDPCEYKCENTPGSHICHCHLGFSPMPENPSRCHDTDECQIPGTCQQMCVNYEGGFECHCDEGYELMSDQYSCQKRGGEGDDQSPVTPHFPWVIHQPGSLWDPVDYDWNPQQSHTDWPPEEDQFVDRLTDPTKVVNSDAIWVTSAPQNPPTHVAAHDEEVIDTGGADWLKWDQISQSESQSEPNIISTRPSPTTSYTNTPDINEHDKEETTTALPFLSTPTISEGAWNWWSDTSSQEPDDLVNMPTDFSNYNEEDNSHFPVEDLGQEKKNYVEITQPQDPGPPTKLPPSQSPLIKAAEIDDIVDSVQEDRGQKQTTTGLLVGLLVPICLIIVVIVVLGIVYCTRCAVQPRSKNASDCYHWISGAHDKQGAANPSVGVKTHV